MITCHPYEDKRKQAHTVKRAVDIDRSWPRLLRTVISDDQPAKKRSMCQQRNNAVASSAFTNEAPGRWRGAKLNRLTSKFSKLDELTGRGQQNLDGERYPQTVESTIELIFGQ